MVIDRFIEEEVWLKMEVGRGTVSPGDTDRNCTPEAIV
jgi:hypothetical protein